LENESHALVQFKLHAMRTNRAFLMAADLIAQHILRPASMSLIMGNFERPLWNEAVGAEAQDLGLVELAEASLDLLREGLVTSKPNLKESVEQFCELGLWLGLMGCFERNQFAIQFADGQEEEEEHDTTGTGLFSLLCQANHSCDPNAEIVFTQGTNRGSLLALREIKAGEEICVSYIDEDVDDQWQRRDMLREYGFICTCERCVEQDAQDEREGNVVAVVAEDVVHRTDKTRKVDSAVVEHLPETGFNVRHVAGVDVSYVKDSNLAVACAVVCTFPELRVV
jgi:hypothetical protein